MPVLILIAIVGFAILATQSQGINDITSEVSNTVQNWTQQLALAIQQHEGFFTGSHSQRTNNPGNLRPPNGNTTFWTGQTGIDSRGFAIFDTYDDGLIALETNLRVHAIKNPNQTLAEYIAQYAPAEDSNNVDAYVNSVATALGVNSDITLGDLSS